MMTAAEERTYLTNVKGYCEELQEHINQLAKVEISNDFAACLNQAAGCMFLAGMEAAKRAKAIKGVDCEQPGCYTKRRF